MQRYVVLAIALVVLSFVAAAQPTVVTGDRSTPLRPLTGAGNVGISNAVLREQPELRALRVVVDAGGTRVMHSHDNVDFHLFVPITGAMTLNLEDAESVEVLPWQPYYLDAGTRHGFHNASSTPVDIMEIFVR